MTAATRRSSPRMGLPYTVSLEPRLTTSRWLSPGLTAGALVVALLISALILAVVGADPVRVYLHILGASLGSVGVISDTLVKATPLILTGLACALAFRMRLWNIGAEGQLLLGAWAASAVVLVPLVPAGTPGFIVLPVMLLAGFLGGAAWGLIPGALKAKFGVNEIIATLMLNSIAFAWVQYWVFGPWTEGGFQLTEQFPIEAWLPRLSDLAEGMPAFRGLTVHAGFLVALVAAGVVWWIVERSALGYEIKLIGDNPRAARYAGIPISRLILLVFAVSGGLAGMAGMAEVSGVVHRLQDNFSPGYGYTAIIVAYLAKFHPLRVVPIAILFGALVLAGREIQPSGVPAMIQGIILFCLISSEVFLRYRVRIVRRVPVGAGGASRRVRRPSVDLQLIFAAGIAVGTILLFAAVGEILAERAGVLNLGVEGMMLIGAVVGFSTAVATGNPWLGVVTSMLAGGLLSYLHAIITITFRADQVVSGLALTFLGTGLARVLGEGLSSAGSISLLPRFSIPGLSAIPVLGPIAFTDHSILTYVGYLLVPAVWYWIHRTRAGLHLRSVGEEPAAADALGVNVYATRYRYVIAGGMLAGLAGATITLAIQPGWFGALTVNGRGWIAIGLVIFAQWSPFRAAAGAYLFGVVVQLTLSMQLPPTILGLPNPFFQYHPNTFFLEMLPYALVLVALVLGSRQAMRKRIGAPAALGIPYVRGERGR